MMDTMVYVDRLQHLYASGYRNEFVDTAVRKIIDHQIVRDQADLAEVSAVLQAFEKQYGMASALFWTAFQNGELEDTADFMEWNAFCHMEKRLLERLTILATDE